MGQPNGDFAMGLRTDVVGVGYTQAAARHWDRRLLRRLYRSGNRRTVHHRIAIPWRSHRPQSGPGDRDRKRLRRAGGLHDDVGDAHVGEVPGLMLVASLRRRWATFGWNAHRQSVR